MTHADQYRARVNALNLRNQAPAVQKLAGEILKELQAIENALYWAIDPEEQDPGQWASSLTEHAHALVDMGHEYRAALALNPPPKIPEENDGEPLPITR